VPFELRAFGNVEAMNTVSVSSQANGLVTSVHFKEGDFVKKGDLLFTVDTRPYRASLSVAQAALAQSRAVAEQARIEAERYGRLEQEGIATAQQRAKAETDAASSEAAVELGRAQAQSAQLNVNFTRITAPIDGKTGSLLVHAGNVVQAGSAQPLVMLRSLSPIYVRFAVPEEFLLPIRERFGKERLVVRATPRGNGAKTAEGELTFLENSVDAQTGTLSLKATFPNTGFELWPGASVDVALVLRVDRQIIVAPEAAIQEGQNGHYAFAIETGDRAVLRPVKLVRTTETLALIESGLRVGDQVVTEGQIRLRNGSKVRIKPNAAQPKASAAQPKASDG